MKSWFRIRAWPEDGQRYAWTIRDGHGEHIRTSYGFPSKQAALDDARQFVTHLETRGGEAR